MHPADACFALAGEVGINPYGLTLKQLWLMACGAWEASRRRIVESLAAEGAGKVKVEPFIRTGRIVRRGENLYPLPITPLVEQELEKARNGNGRQA